MKQLLRPAGDSFVATLGGAEQGRVAPAFKHPGRTQRGEKTNKSQAVQLAPSFNEFYPLGWNGCKGILPLPKRGSAWVGFIWLNVSSDPTTSLIRPEIFPCDDGIPFIRRFSLPWRRLLSGRVAEGMPGGLSPCLPLSTRTPRACAGLTGGNSYLLWTYLLAEGSGRGVGAGRREQGFASCSQGWGSEF